ncbi:hypothetical protein MMC21_002242 [Puttea exsequens]|nr:hypothetical protein [Puttea exsequens]
METAIRWSTSSTLQKQHFLLVDVNGHSFKRCKVDLYDGKNFKYETLSTYSKCPPFRAFDWSPCDESLVAVGQWSGEVTVLRIDNTSPNVSLPAKHQRLCNAVAFSRTGLLAAGLERVRNDFCLNIWDVNQRLLPITSPGAGPAKPFVEPYRKFASSEAISSIKFLASQPEVLVVGVKGRGVRVFDLRENTGNPSLHFRTEAVYNIALDPLEENYFACAGANKDATIQIWDRRSGSPFTAANLASGSDIGQAEKPVLEYKEAFADSKSLTPTKKWDGSGPMVSSIWSLRYCKGKSGYLGALASNGDFKVFETKHPYASHQEQYKAVQTLDYDIPDPNGSSIFTQRVHQIEPAYEHVRSRRHENDRIVAFDFTNLAGSRGTPSAITLRGDGNTGIVELGGGPKALSVSSLGTMIVGRNHAPGLRRQRFSIGDQFEIDSIRKFVPHEEGPAVTFVTTNRGTKGLLANHEGTSSVDGRNQNEGGLQSSCSSHKRLLESRYSGGNLSMEYALTIANLARRRCAEGYLFDCKRNVDIVRDDPWLQKLWRWIAREYQSLLEVHD